MESQPAQIPPITSPQPPTGSSQQRPDSVAEAGTATVSWPDVPPAPVPVKPLVEAPVPAPPARVTVARSTGSSGVPAPPGGLAAAPVQLEADGHGGAVGEPGDPQQVITKHESASMPVADPPPAASATPAASTTPAASATPAAAAGGATRVVPQPRRGAGAAEQGESPLTELQRVVRRQQASDRGPGEDLVWRPRFAYTSALIILIALTVVSLPLWLVLYRISTAATSGGTGPRVADLVALCMMLLGGFLTGAAAWVIIIEMRGRVRMVDTLARTGEREALITPAAPEIPVLDAPIDRLGVAEPIGSARPVPGAARPELVQLAEAHQVGAAATLEASSKLLASFSSVLKSFGQLAAQVAMLAVALALFIGATVLSLN